MKRKIAIVFILYFFVVFIAYYYITGIFGVVSQHIMYLISPVLAILGGIYTTRIYGIKNIHAKSIALITAGIIAWFSGELCYIVLDDILKQNPYPSVADIFYLSGYPLVFGGLLIQLKAMSENSSGVIKNSIMITIAFILSLLIAVSVGFIDFHMVYDPSISFIENAIGFLYSFGDLLLTIAIIFILLIRWEFRGGKLSFPWVIILIASNSTLIGDVLYARYAEQFIARQQPYLLIDLFYVASYLLFSYGFILIGLYIREVQDRIRK